MTQLATPAGVVGNFDGVKLELLGKTYQLERRGDEFWVEMEDPEWRPGSSAHRSAPRVRRRLGLLTGSHHMQVYWFAQDQGNMQALFPFVWLIADRRWAPFHNTFLRDPATAPVGQTWNLNCINCHATAGQPRPNHHTKQFETRAGELGIACEACHGPAEAHVSKHRNLAGRYWQYLSGPPDPSIVNPAKLPAKKSAQVCGQCHGIKWIPNREDHLENGFRYRPGQELAETAPIVRPTRLAEQPWLTNPLKQNPTFLRDRYWADGMVRVSGREHNGLLESACYQRGELSCVSCHSMHQSQSADDQLAKRMESNQACVQCHAGIGEKLVQHTHHPANSSGSLCYNCHMPHTTYGLLKAIRSHQIDSPSVRASLETGRPNACNLCHLDQTLGWTAQHLSSWYQQPAPALNDEHRSTSAALLWLLKGDAGQRALMAWSMGWEPAQDVSGKDWLPPYLAQLLDDPYSAVRYIAFRSLKSLGADYERLPYDFVGPAANLAAAKSKVLDLWKSEQNPPRRNNQEALLLSDGQWEQTRLEGLLKERNNLSMDLQE
jgi:predicted CXXCH cytochrome family protein